jgi:hypothetical protein
MSDYGGSPRKIDRSYLIRCHRNDCKHSRVPRVAQLLLLRALRLLPSSSRSPELGHTAWDPSTPSPFKGLRKLAHLSLSPTPLNDLDHIICGISLGRDRLSNMDPATSLSAQEPNSAEEDVPLALTPRLCRISLPQSRAARESLATWVCNRCDSQPLAQDRRYHCAICNNGDYDVCDRCFHAGATCLDPAHHLSEPAPEPDVAIEDDVGKGSILPCVACYRSVRYLSELHRCATCHSDNAGLCSSCLRNGIWCSNQAHELTRSVLRGNDTKDLDPIDRIAFDNRGNTESLASFWPIQK